MTLNEIMNVIEGPEFFAELAIASGVDSFLRYASRSEDVKRLLRYVKASQDGTQVVFQRIVQLLETSYDEQFTRPSDTALATYLWVLDAIDRSYSQIIAVAFLKTKDLWWAKQVAERVLKIVSGVNVSTGNDEIILSELLAASANSAGKWSFMYGLLIVSAAVAVTRGAKITPVVSDTDSSEASSTNFRILPGEDKYYRVSLSDENIQQIGSISWKK